MRYILNLNKRHKGQFSHNIDSSRENVCGAFTSNKHGELWDVNYYSVIICLAVYKKEKSPELF